MKKREQLLNDLGLLIELVETLTQEQAERVRIDFRYWRPAGIEEMRWVCKHLRDLRPHDGPTVSETSYVTGFIGETIDSTVYHDHLLAPPPVVHVSDMSLLEARDDG